MAPSWTHAPVSFLILVLGLVGPVWAGPRSLLPDDQVVATVNVTATDSRGNIVHMISFDDGLFGQHSPKTETGGVVLTPAPQHGECVRTLWILGGFPGDSNNKHRVNYPRLAKH